MEQRYLEKLLRLKNNFSVKIITGILGAGKTTLLKDFAENLKASGVADNEIIFFDCAADERPNNFQQLYNLVIKRTATLEKFFLLIDDIDRVTESEKAINALFVGAPAEIYVTVSSDAFAEKISALLPENCDVLKIYPPSFAEYMKIFPEDTANALQRYLRFGNLYITRGADEKFLPIILRGLTYEIFFNVAAKNSLQKADVFAQIIKLIAQNIGKKINLTELLKILQADNRSFHRNSLKNYLSFIDEFFIKVPRLDIKTGKIFSHCDEIFCADNGLLNALRNFIGDDTPLIENAVCIELLRRGFKVSRGVFGEMNVSFVAERNDEKIFVQVLPTDGSITPRRITRPFRAMPDDIEKILISMEPVKATGAKNITLQDFLINA